MSDISNTVLGAKLIYNLQYPAELIWKSGSDHNYKGAFYRMRVNEPDCALGDTFVPHQPFRTWFRYVYDFLGNNKSPVIRKIQTDAAVKPKDFVEIFSGSRLTVYRMIPPSSDYVCLGDVAVASSNTLSEDQKSKYCCVKKKYTVLGQLKWDWNLRGDKNKNKGQVWRIARTFNGAQFETFGINSGNFLFQTDTNNPFVVPTNEVRQLIGDDYDVMESNRIGRGKQSPIRST